MDTNAVRIGTVVSIQTQGRLARYTLSTGYEWEDAAGLFTRGERVKVIPYIVELVHVEHFDD